MRLKLSASSVYGMDRQKGQGKLMNPRRKIQYLSTCEVLPPRVSEGTKDEVLEKVNRNLTGPEE